MGIVMDNNKLKGISNLRQFFEKSADKFPYNTALICDYISMSYHELEEKANQLANYLLTLGVSPGCSVGIFLDRSLNSYISILAVLKAGAAYVPIEVEYPDDRVNYILQDMPFHSVITTTSLMRSRTKIEFPNTVLLDAIEKNLQFQSVKRPSFERSPIDHLCYVIYTSGSTGRPKGVEITHSNICHYVSVASDLYKIIPLDRIYQGFSLAFDASLEELWMAFANGATLIACTKKDTRSGVGLIDFLQKHKVSVFSTVPTLLATLEGQLPHLRLLILGGEACSLNLIKRWARAGLRILNTYGPTEATVIATWAECVVNKPITIGKPLAGYEILILDENLQPVSPGNQGELCIGGPAVSRGYVNRPEMTASKFVLNPNKPSQRLYRTGDLASTNDDGDIVFLGRIDDQVKLRGFRVELNEIEMVVMEYGAISQVAISMQEVDQNVILVAYLSLKTQAHFDEYAFKDFLKSCLPHYMIPSIIEIVEEFPLLDSGKINRKALPKPKNKAKESAVFVAPQNELEEKISKIWSEELQIERVSVEADLFYDLGGHSLSAAKIVSSLRRIEGLQEISILDLYLHPTIKRLAEKFHRAQLKKVDNRKAKKHRVNPLNYYLCAIGQFFGCLLQYAIGAWQLLTVILCCTWVINRESIFSKESLFILTALFLLMPILSLAITICAKWILLGRIKPGVYKLWGWFYFRWWLVERLQKNLFSPAHLTGSPLITLYYRLLGAKIGKNCYIGTINISIPDQITIGNNCSIGFDSRLLGYVVEDGWLKIGSITIENNCYIGARSVVSINTILHENSKLDDMSMLPTNSEIPPNQFFSGSPASLHEAPSDHITNHQHSQINSSALSTCIYGLLHYLSLVFVMLIYYACYFPAILFISHFHEKTHYLLTISVAAPIGAITFLLLHYLAIGTCKKLLMNKIRPGTYSLKSFYYLRQWTIVKMVDIEEIYVMADTLYLPYFMRFLGAKLGKHVEMGETPHIIPDLITIQDEGFIASAVALAWPNVYLGSIKFAPIQVGKRGFIGNMSLLPSGSNLGEGGLLGCLSITPPGNRAADNYTAWLGSPAMFLPKREVFTGYSDQEKFVPPKKMVTMRLIIEFVRIIMPTTFGLIGLSTMLYIYNLLIWDYSLSSILVIFPLASTAVTCCLIACIIALKWILLGKLKPTTKPIWNVFIWKNDIITYLFNYFVNPHFTELVLGTPFASFLLRLFGAKIGKRVFIDSSDFTECDLISIDNDVCINSEATIQTHLYEDRIFKMSTITIHEGCNVGVASIVLYNTVMEANSTLGNFSLLMKGERLPADSSWQGIPAQPMHIHYEQLNMKENINLVDPLEAPIS